MKNLDDAFEKQSKYYNLRRRDFRYRISDLVLLRTYKLSSKETNMLPQNFVLPILVHLRFRKYILLLFMTLALEKYILVYKSKVKVHIEDLKPYRGSTNNND